MGEPERTLWDDAISLVEELRDYGSERRHVQLLSICREAGLDHLPKVALDATRRRLAQERELGPVGSPAKYYTRVLLRHLAERQVFVPKAAEVAEQQGAIRAELGLPLEATVDEVRAALRASMGSLGAD